MTCSQRDNKRRKQIYRCSTNKLDRAKYLQQFVEAFQMSLRSVDAPFLGEPTIAVHDDGDVFWNASNLQYFVTESPEPGLHTSP